LRKVDIYGNCVILIKFVAKFAFKVNIPKE